MRPSGPTDKEEKTIKLLIVDDETLTRTGLQTSVNWIKLGIDEVILASDGQDGFHKASVCKPEIILSDVRMPRMNGIEMMERIHAILPESIFIFMSGYSDKEYLKAAIRLQAVDYVEKPLDLHEVRKAVHSAVSRYEKLMKTKNAESLSETLSAGHLALYLSMPRQADDQHVQQLLHVYFQKYGSIQQFHAAVTLILQIDGRIRLKTDFLNTLIAQLENFCHPMHMHILAAEKKPNVFLFHVFRKTSFSENTVSLLTRYLQDCMKDISSYYISSGSIVSSVPKLYDSYCAAVISLQQGFFFQPGTILTKTEKGNLPPETPPASLTEELTSAIREARNDRITELTEELYRHIHENPRLLKRSVLSLYYHLLTIVQEQRKIRLISGKNPLSSTAQMMEALEQCFSYSELHAILKKSLREYMDDLEQHVPENSSVYLIKCYMRDHYSNPLLSTKEISDYASLSASYACTIFKNETGQTLNQYLTELRLEKAKELLTDPRNNVADVATLVGYNDSNYFGKAFKKYTGVSPSEYRDNRS